jgi:Sec-independent protein secretion pathway component TatC
VTSEQLRRNWRIGIVVVFVVAILLPTVDPVSLAFEVVPLLALYFLSVWLATYMEKRWDLADQTSRWSEG